MIKDAEVRIEGRAGMKAQGARIVDGGKVDIAMNTSCALSSQDLGANQIKITLTGLDPEQMRRALGLISMLPDATPDEAHRIIDELRGGENANTRNSGK